MSYVVSCCKTRANAPTCMAVETLERDRPSRSDSRLEETAEGWEFTGAGETKKKKKKKTGRNTLNATVYLRLLLYCATGQLIDDFAE